MKNCLTNHWTFFKEKEPAKTVEFQLKDDQIDLDTLCGPGVVHDRGIVSTEFELDEDARLGFGIGCDWWCEVTLNGKMIFSTFPSGNGGNGHKFSPKNKPFAADAVKGKNKLSIMIERGEGSWTFCFREFENPEAPLTLELDPSDTVGELKRMNAVNNGPIRARSDQTRGNMPAWQKLDIPFARNHDASFCSSYGGEHAVDIHAIFPDFDADVNDPASYDFTLTDKLIEDTLAGGTQIFYRLGSKIEHNIKKYGVKVPKDFKKWACICEHIIRHYNEGWADGFHRNIQYWEIWNEPDLTGGATWQGTPEQFFDLYRTTACHLKKCFPELKIGGPALGHNLKWMEKFLTSMTTGEVVPIDFFSWHCYGTSPDMLTVISLEIRRILDSFGYTKTESILNEWNYVRGWSDDWIYSLKTMQGLKGAVFTGSVMCASQNAPIDMLMYYDARPCAMNGIFDLTTFEPLKTYYTFLAWKKLKDLKTQFRIDLGDHLGVYACGATDGSTTRMLLTRYHEPDQLPVPVSVSIKLKKGSMMGAKLFLLDETHDLTEVPYFTEKEGFIRFTMKANTLVLVEI